MILKMKGLNTSSVSIYSGGAT